MSAYSIVIDRGLGNSGKLRYTGSFSGTFDCWWDPKDSIPSGLYPGCSATKMATAKNSRGQPREGIFLPHVPGRFGIFIHYWPGPGANLGIWSDGCALLLEPDMLKIWNDIEPKNGRNIMVDVKEPQAFNFIPRSRADLQCFK